MSERSRGVGLRARLLVLALVPALLLGALAGSLAARKRSDAALASDLQVQVAGLAGLVEVRTALLLARTPVEVEVRSAILGLDPETTLELLDLDPEGLGDLTAVADAIGSLPAAVRPFGQDAVDELDTMMDEASGIEVLERFQELDRATDATWYRELDTIGRSAAELGDADLVSRLADLEHASMAGASSASLLTGLADYWFGIISESPQIEEARVAVGVADARFDDAVAALQLSDSEDAVASAAAIAEVRSSGRFGTAIDDAVAGRPAEPFVDGVDLALLVETFTDSFAEFGPLLDFVNERSAALERSAERAASDASASAWRTIVGATLAIVVLLVLSALVAGSVERPLRRLIDATRRVGGGDLHGDLLPSTGPNEVVAASEAFNDVVVNLRLLEGKLHALAICDLEHPILQQPLPGELGDALEASIVVLSDSVADRSTLQAELAHQATHDALTGIANRAGALEALAAALARAQRHRTTLGLAFLDLDGFKRINDAHGHRAGDLVLQEVADRLATHARTGDFCARLGGDEFIIIAEQIGGPDDALALGRRLAAIISEPMEVDDQAVQVGASFGVALTAPGVDEAPLDLVARADLAAYCAKRAGSVVELAGTPEGGEVPIP